MASLFTAAGLDKRAPRPLADRLRPERLVDAGILVPIAFNARRIKGIAVMKLYPLAQGHLQGAVVEPAPAGGEAWDEFPPLLEIPEVLEDVQHHGDKVIGAAIDNPQFSARRGGLFRQAAVTPSEDDKEKNATANDEFLHG